MSTLPASPLADLTAVLLCGGKGERLRPFTEHLPKPLVPLHGKPLLQHLLRFLHIQGVRRFVLCTGYKAEAISRFLAEEQPLPPDCSVVCVDSGEAASMADRVLDARPHVSGRALICYGDTLANVSLGSLARHHSESGALATMTVYPLRSPYGIVSLEDSDRVVGLREKPVLPYWINIGFILCEPAALDMMRRGTDLVSFLEALTEHGAVRAWRHQGKHLTVNTEKERSEAEGEIEFFTLQEGTGA